MEKIVELIRHDKGIMTAIEHDYYEPIEVSEKKNGMEVVIDGAIVDEHGLVLFYTINSEKKQTEIMMENVVLKNMKGEEVKYGSHSFGTPHYSEKGEKTFNGTIEYFFENPFAERELQLEIELKGDTYNLPFTLKGEIKAKKTYAINQTVTIEGQKIHLVEATVYPLRVGVHVKLIRTTRRSYWSLKISALSMGMERHGQKSKMELLKMYFREMNGSSICKAIILRSRKNFILLSIKFKHLIKKIVRL